MPDATPTSTAPPSPPRRSRPRKPLWTAVQLLLTAVILWYVGKGIARQWNEFHTTPLTLEPRWGMLVLSALFMLAAFAVLIDTWRRMVTAWGDALPFPDAARIWWVSSLVRYLPYNQVFQVGAVAELSRRQRISPAAGAGASVINVAVNIATGFMIAFIAGYAALNRMTHGYAAVGLGLAVAMLIGVLLLPLLLPHMLGMLRAMTGRDLALGRLPVSAIYISLVGNLVAWILYGLSYRALVAGVIGGAPGPAADYVAVYASAYVAGYLAFLAPAGAIVREASQIDALTALGLATVPQATTIAVSARVLSMILEIVPAVLLLSRGTRLRPQSPTSPDGSPR